MASTLHHSDELEGAAARAMAALLPNRGTSVRKGYSLEAARRAAGQPRGHSNTNQLNTLAPAAAGLQKAVDEPELRGAAPAPRPRPSRPPPVSPVGRRATMPAHTERTPITRPSRAAEAGVPPSPSVDMMEGGVDAALKTLLPGRGDSVRARGINVSAASPAARARRALAVSATSEEPTAPEPELLSAADLELERGLLTAANAAAEKKKTAATIAARAPTTTPMAAPRHRAVTMPVVGAGCCQVCRKPAYAMEKLEADGKIYHTWCFRCTECNKAVSTGSYAALDGKIYCKPHFKKLFKLKGNYNEGFGTAQRKHDPKWCPKPEPQPEAVLG